MSTSDRVLTITEDQLTSVHQGDIGSFAVSMIKLGMKIGSDYMLESYKGPYKSDVDGQLLVLKLKSLKDKLES